MSRYSVVLLTIALAAGSCSTTVLPPGQESRTEFVQHSSLSARDAYILVAKQMRSCFRVIGLFGNGYDIQADAYGPNGGGRIELYHVGLSGASKPEDSMFSRTIVITPGESGSTIVTTGTTPKYVYMNHRAIAGWLNGNDSCRIEATE